MGQVSLYRTTTKPNHTTEKRIAKISVLFPSLMTVGWAPVTWRDVFSGLLDEVQQFSMMDMSRAELKTFKNRTVLYDIS